MKIMTKYLHLVLGWICVALGLIAAVLPIVPTTVFLIMAAYFFTKGSPRLRQRLIDMPRIGPAILYWERTGAIAPRIKRLAIVSMGGVFVVSVLFGTLFGLAPIALAVQALFMALAATYILTRPSA